MEDYIKIVYLPYLITGDQFQFGRITFSSFKDIKGIIGIYEKFYLEAFFEKHIDHTQKKLDITILSKDGVITNQWSDLEILEMQDTVNFLCFLSTWNVKTNALFPMSSDNFMMYTKNFNLTSNSMSISTGSYIHIETLYTEQFAKKLLFVKPEYIHQNTLNKEPWYFDELLYVGVSQALFNDHSQKWILPISRSLSFYKLAVSNSHGIGFFDRIVLMVSAIETIIKKTGSSKKFALSIVEKIGYNHSDELFSQTDENISYISKKIYELRSRYTHGQELSMNKIIDDRFGNLLNCSLYIFGLLIKSILREHSYLRNYSDLNERWIAEYCFGLKSLKEINVNNE